MKSKATYILAISLGSAALSARAQLDDYGPSMLDAPPLDQPAAFAGFHRPLTLAPPDGQSGGGGSSQDEQEKLNEISKQLSNPVSSLWAMFTEVDLVAFDGDLNTGGVKLGSRMIFQPIMPIPLFGEEKEDRWKLIMRPNVPIIFSQPVPKGVDDFDYLGGLGDIELPLMVAPPLGNFIAGVGPVFLFPTATEDAFGQDQWGLGPALVLGYQAKKWLFVTQSTYEWGIGGGNDDSPDVSSGNLIYIFLYNLPKAWQIGCNPTIIYNHNASSNNRWNVPVGLTVSKTVKVGKMPTKFQLAFEYSVIHEEDFGQRAQVRLNILPVVPSIIQTPIFGGR